MPRVIRDIAWLAYVSFAFLVAFLVVIPLVFIDWIRVKFGLPPRMIVPDTDPPPLRRGRH